MSRYNNHFANHFGSCRLLAYARDTCRNRDVRIYQIPNEWDVAGVADGTDCWIVPVVRGAQYFHRVDVWSILNDIKEGKTLPKPEPIVSSGRRRVALDDAQLLLPIPQAPGRRRAILEEPQPQPTEAPRRRRVTI